MKKFIITSIAVIAFAAAQGQEKNANPIVEKSFKVEGVCKMCKKRIEEAALRTKGVKAADWDKNKELLTVVYNSKKVEEKEIHTAIAEKGHETSLVETDSTSYLKLPDCCRYKEGAVCHD